MEPAASGQGVPAGGRQARRRWWIAAAVVAAVVAVAGFALLRPDTLFTDTRVVDSIPDEIDQALGVGTVAPGNAVVPTTAAGPDAQAAPTTAVPATPAPAEPVPPDPVLVGRGSFVSQGGHRAAGTASVVRGATGTVLVLDDLDVQNGPDLYVYLSPSAAGNVDGGVQVAPLRGNQGRQLYELPPGTDVAEVGNVVIWCERFSVPFGTATLAG